MQQLLPLLLLLLVLMLPLRLLMLYARLLLGLLLPLCGAAYSRLVAVTQYLTLKGPEFFKLKILFMIYTAATNRGSDKIKTVCRCMLTAEARKLNGHAHVQLPLGPLA